MNEELRDHLLEMLGRIDRQWQDARKPIIDKLREVYSHEPMPPVFLDVLTEEQRKELLK